MCIRDSQINNVLAFPGIFRGALDVRASDINEEMKIAAANALAGLVDEGKLNADFIKMCIRDRCKKAMDNGQDILSVVVESGILDEPTARRLLDPHTMVSLDSRE